MKPKEAFYLCPHFEICQINDCPLAKKPNKYRTLPEDKLLYNYHKCRATKKLRMKIAKEFNMENQGLTPRELSGAMQSIKLKSKVFLKGDKSVESPKMLPLEAASSPDKPKEDL